MITNKLIENAVSAAGDRKIKDIRAGLSYTAVMLDDHACGLAYTFRDRLGHFCGVMGEAGNITGKSAAEVIPWLNSKNLLMAAMGLATINAVLNHSNERWDEGNITAALDLAPTDVFGMVGSFGPILNVVKRKTDNIYVFEQRTDKAPGLYPEADIPIYLPKCDVIVITATSIINHTIDQVLAHCGDAREVCLVGSAKGFDMEPEAFWKAHGGPVARTPGGKLHFVSAVLDSYRRNMTEIDYINGAVVREGKKYGIDCPYNETVWRLVRLMQDTYRGQYDPAADC